MEKKIHQILIKHTRHNDSAHSRIVAAEEITAHVMEFIKWLHMGTDDTWEVGQEDLWWVKDVGDYLTVEEVYQYWINSVHSA